MMLDRSQQESRTNPLSGIQDATRVDEVMFLDELATLLRVSRSTIERRRKAGAFPIPELGALDRRPRWSRRAVERYLYSEPRLMRARGRRQAQR